MDASILARAGHAEQQPSNSKIGFIIPSALLPNFGFEDECLLCCYSFIHYFSYLQRGPVLPPHPSPHTKHLFLFLKIPSALPSKFEHAISPLHSHANTSRCRCNPCGVSSQQVRNSSGAHKGTELPRSSACCMCLGGWDGWD